MFLACDDPYATARFMTETLGWAPDFSSPAESRDPMACVSLSGAQVRLGPADEQWLAAASRDHRGAGVTVYIRLPETDDITLVHERHAAGGVVTRPLEQRPWGELAFDAVIAGYRFLIAQELLAGDS